MTDDLAQKTRNPRSRWNRLAISAIACALLMAGSPALAQNYVSSDMGGLSNLDNPVYTRGINNLGQVVGIQNFSAGGSSAVLWNGSTWNPLASPAGTSDAGATSINDFGQIAGYAVPTGVDASFGVRWDNGVPTPLDTLNNYDIAYTINSSGQIAGLIWSNQQTSHPATWVAGGTAMTELPTLGGSNGYIFNSHAINNAGDMVGATNTNNDDANHGTAWIGGVTYDLGTLGGTNSEANGINNAGQIVGDAMLAGDITRPVIWDSFSSSPTDLGTLGGAQGMAMVINDNGLIAGWSDTAAGVSHITLWDHGHIFDLTQFIPADPLAAGWQSLPSGNNSILSSDFLDMNNAGVIISTLYDANLEHAIPIMFTPTPVPIPAAVWLFGSGLAGLVGVLKRRQPAA